MNRIDSKFKELKNKKQKALITFVTAGDPDLETTLQIVKEMEKKGVDIIELGVPYSDPIAEGPVIQRANKRAMENSITIKDVMDLAYKIRQSVKLPVLFLLYFNCIIQYGIERFFKDCVKSGVDGVIIPDLPYEERDEIEDICDKLCVYPISLVSPTSKERINKIAKSAKGFIYCVSSLGVTGIRKKFDTDFDSFFSNIDEITSLPKALGFGISTPQHVRLLKRYCDGLIVGSAIVKQIERSAYPHEAVRNVGDFVKQLRNALDDGSL